MGNVDDERRYQEATQPRPVALQAEKRFVVVSKITWWMPGDKTILIAFEDEENYLRVPDPDGMIDAALRALFRVVTL